LWGLEEASVRAWRASWGIWPQYYLVDTCAAEFEAKTPYYYSTYEQPAIDLNAGGQPISSDPILAADKDLRPGLDPSAIRKVMVLGGGPNRIGQGIEFDYCCVHAAMALRSIGIEVIMVNSNPETVSTDYDTSDRLYFEPVTLEDVLNIVHREQPDGVVVQFGGQTPLNLAVGLAQAGVPILGTSADAVDRAEDRQRFKQLLEELHLRQPTSGTALTLDEAKYTAQAIGYPCLIRPSYVLGGRAMQIAYDEEQLTVFAKQAFEASPGFPILIDQFLDDAIELDVDVVGDAAQYVIGGMLEHIEFAGVHSGDSAMVLPPHTLGEAVLDEIRGAALKLARALRILGLMNVQFAVKEEVVYILEVNPRASRTVPFISKAVGVPLARVATLAMVGHALQRQGLESEVVPPYMAVKESVFPFTRFQGMDILLGPEMRSTGEVMGIDEQFGQAFIKSQLAAGQHLPRSGTVFISVYREKREVVLIAKQLESLGYAIVATRGTASVLQRCGVKVRVVNKIHEGRPNVLDLIKSNGIHLIINTPAGRTPRADEAKIRAAATALGIPCITTIAGAQASVHGIYAMLKEGLDVRPIQEYHQRIQHELRFPF
jgi:carbamoyl-phosphate synthase large subunit